MCSTCRSTARQNSPALAIYKGQSFLILGNHRALVTVYEFKPLIGVTKTIMPNGTVNTYEYDALGRLVKIYDHHGTVTQQFQYNYKRQ